MNFIFALQKCTLARGAMQNRAKLTYVKAVTLLLKTNLASLKEVWKCLSKTGDAHDCWMGHIVITGRLVSLSAEQEPWGRTSGKGNNFQTSPSCSAEGASTGAPGPGERWWKLTVLKPNWNMYKLGKALKHFGLNYSLIEVCWCLWSYTLDESVSLAWEMSTAWL